MRKPMFAVVIAAVLGVGIIVGSTFDSEPTTVPAPTQVTAGTQHEPRIDAVLGAINLMKPNFKGTASEASHELYKQLMDQGYYYVLTHDDHTERIDYPFFQSGKVPVAIEFEFFPGSGTMNAARYGVSSDSWGVWCDAPIGRPVPASMITLINKVNKAASARNADPSCVYSKFRS